MKKACVCLVILLLCATGVFAAGAVEDPPYPRQDLRVVVPYSAGGGSDTFARTIQRYIDLDGNAFVVTNVAGAGGSIGTIEVLNSRSDGYTVLFHSITALVGGYYAGNFEERIYERFEPVSSVFAMFYGIIVRQDAPYQTIDELVAYDRANPGRLSLAIAGVGGAAHIVGLNFADAVGIDFHIVPYPGAADVTAAIEGGHADVAVLGTSESFDFIRAGNFIQLGYSADVPVPGISGPTFRESGIDFSFTHRNGFLFPEGTPQKAVDFFEERIRAVAENEQFIAEIEARGAFVDYLGSDEFHDFLYELDSMIQPYEALMR